MRLPNAGGKISRNKLRTAWNDRSSNHVGKCGSVITSTIFESALAAAHRNDKICIRIHCMSTEHFGYEFRFPDQFAHTSSLATLVHNILANSTLHDIWQLAIMVDADIIANDLYTANLVEGSDALSSCNKRWHCNWISEWSNPCH